MAAAVLTSSLLLLASGASHVRGPSALRAVLAAHRVVRTPTGIGRAAVAVPLAELLTGLLPVAALGTGLRPALAAAVGGQAALFAAFAGYLTLAVRAGSTGLPCGCGLPEVPVGPSSVARAAGLGLLAALAAIWVGGPWSAELPTRPAELLLVAVAAPTLALLLAIVAPARHSPAASPPIPLRTTGATP